MLRTVRTVTSIATGAVLALGVLPGAVAAPGPLPGDDPVVAVGAATGTTAPDGPATPAADEAPTDDAGVPDGSQFGDRGDLAPMADAPSADAPSADTATPDGDDAQPSAAATDHVLVRFEPTASAPERDDALSAQGTAAGDPVAGGEFVEVPVTGDDPAALVAELEADPRVAEAQLDHVRTADAWPSDPLAADARAYLELLRLPRAWDVTTGSGQVVAVLDTGIDPTHPEFAGRIVGGYDAVRGTGDATEVQWHGTAVAGAAVAAANRVGGVGAAHGASVMPVRVLDANGDGYDSDVARGIRWAADSGADVINLSLGGPAASPVLRDAVQYAVNRGSVVLAAAGNTGTQAPQYPAAYAPQIAGLLSVGATDHAGALAPFSSWGDTVTLAAPGTDVVVPWRGGGYGVASGTSFATPLVSGIAALLTARGGTPAQVEHALVSTARDAGPRGTDPSYGAGIADAAAALGLGTAAPLELAPGDPGDDGVPARAVPLALGRDASATLAPEGDEDWYRVTVTASGGYTVTVTPTGAGTSGRPRITALDAAGTVLGTADAPRQGTAVTLTVPVPAAGAVRFGVRDVSGAVGGAYRLSVRATGAVTPAAGAATAPAGAQWVLDASHAQHATGLPVRPTLSVTAGRTLAPGTVGPATVRLRDAGTGADVAVTRGYDAATGIVSVRPTADLTPGRHYLLWVGGLTDTAGRVQPEPYRLHVTVGAGGDRFTPVDPWRALDTRSGLGASGPVPAATPVRLDLGTRVPADATAVVLNVTAVKPAAAGWVRVYPTPTGSQAAPTVSNLNVVAGVDQPNAVTVALGAGGDVTFATSVSTHLLADVAGYYRPGGATGYVPLDPVRVLDTRDGTGGVAAAAVTGGRWVDLQVAGRAGVPGDASAVVLNVTGASPTASTNVRVYPAPAASASTAPPTVSNLNLVPGRAQPNLVTVKVGDGGRVRMWSQSGAVHLVADLAGYYSPTGDRGFVPVAPARIADSRQGSGVAGVLRSGVPSSLVVAGVGGVPADAEAAVLNVTAVKAVASSDLRVYPLRAGGAVPLVSNLNMPRGRDEPNLVIARLGTGGAVQLYARTDVHVVVDVAGYFRR